MGAGDFIDKIKHEGKALVGDEAKNRVFDCIHEYPDEETARKEFERSRIKLFNVNKWSDMPGFTCKFQLYDPAGNPTPKSLAQEGDFVKILLPGPFPEYWVKVVNITNKDDIAAIAVSPDKDPKGDPDTAQTDHFFTKEALNILKVELKGKVLKAYEFGRNEIINNSGEEAGDREIVNTLAAEGGWAFFQKVQWKTLNDYLIHNIEI